MTYTEIAEALCSENKDLQEALGETVYDCIVSDGSASFHKIGADLIDIISVAVQSPHADQLLEAIDKTIIALGGVSLEGILGMIEAKE